MRDWFKICAWNAGLLLLALIVIETVLARWFSHAFRSSPGVGTGGIAPSLHETIAGGAGGTM